MPRPAARITARLALALGLCLLASCAEPRRGKVLERWEVGSGTFRVRVTVHAEGNWHQYYRNGRHNVIEWSPTGRESWREFAGEYMTEPEQFPRDNVRLVNETTAYAFWHDWFVVTTDGGNQWSRWRLSKVRPALLLAPGVRQEARVEPDGTGVMLLQLKVRPDPESQSVPKTFELRTTDFGQNWLMVREL